MALTKVTSEMVNPDPSDGIKSNQDDIALLGFKVATNGSLAKYNLVDQTVDDFQDASGVNTGSSTNEERDSSGKYYKGMLATTPTVTSNHDSTGTDGDYTWYRWTTVRTDGSYVNDTTQSTDFLVIAGGGGGGGDDSGGSINGGGGGGAGGYRNSFASEASGGGGSSETALSLVASTTYTVSVGAGGARGSTGSDGAVSSIVGSDITDITTVGGGGGGTAGSSGSGGTGRLGGSGSGGGRDSGTSSGGAGTANQGYAGGAAGGSTAASSGGGGGASAVGYAGHNPDGAADPFTTGDTYSKGGAGLSSSIDGSATTRSGGGGGSYENSDGTADSQRPQGGSGGGGNGVCSTGSGLDAVAGTVNTGSGGGAGKNAARGAAGGSGIVIIRRETAPTIEGNNMTLISATTAAQAAPTKGDVVFTYTNGAGTTTLGTDVTAEISADGGSTWTAMTLGSEGSTGSHNIATAHDVTITSTISSPWNMAYRIKTLNQAVGKTTRIQAVSLGWS